MGKHSVTFVVGVLVSALAIYLAFRNADVSQLLASFENANLAWSGPIVGLLAIFYLLKLQRWRLMLTSPLTQPSAGSIAGPMMIGFAANNLLPFRVGEVIRLILASRATDIRYITVLGSLILERVFDLIAILLLGTALLISMQDAVSELPFESYFAPAALTALLSVFVAAFFSKRLLSVAKRCLKPLPTQLAQSISTRLDAIELPLATLRSPTTFLFILGNSLLQWCALAVTMLIACIAVGIDVPYVAAVYILILTTIGIALPSTPGFVGVIEYCFVLALAAFDVPAAQALAAAIFYHVLTWASVTITGTYFLRRQSLSWRAVSRSDPA